MVLICKKQAVKEVWVIFEVNLENAIPLEIIGNGSTEFDRLDVA